MRHTKIPVMDVVLEILAAMGAVTGIGLELYYFKMAGTGLSDAVVTILFVAGIYLLFSVMERYPAVWNLLIPARQKSRIYAVRLALGIKVLFMGMTVYTAACDVYRIYSSSVVFWAVVVASVVLVIFMKYRMWQSNRKEDRKNSGGENGSSSI